MQKNLSILIFSLLLEATAFSQTNYQRKLDSLRLELAVAKADTTKANIMFALLSVYDYHKPAEGIKLKDSALQIARNSNSKIRLARVNEKIGRIYWRLGKFSEAYPYHFTALQLYEQVKDTPAINYVLVQIGQDYLNDTKFDEARDFLVRALKQSQASKDKLNIVRSYNIL